MTGKELVPVVKFDSKRIEKKSDAQVPYFDKYLNKLNLLQKEFQAISCQTFLVTEFGYKSIVSIFQSMVGNKYYVSLNELEDLEFCCFSNSGLTEYCGENEDYLLEDIDTKAILGGNVNMVYVPSEMKIVNNRLLFTNDEPTPILGLRFTLETTAETLTTSVNNYRDILNGFVLDPIEEKLKRLSLEQKITGPFFGKKV